MKKDYKLLRVKIPEGYQPTVFEIVKNELFIYCDKKKWSKVSFSLLENKK